MTSKIRINPESKTLKLKTMQITNNNSHYINKYEVLIDAYMQRKREI